MSTSFRTQFSQWTERTAHGPLIGQFHSLKHLSSRKHRKPQPVCSFSTEEDIQPSQQEPISGFVAKHTITIASVLDLLQRQHRQLNSVDHFKHGVCVASSIVSGRSCQCQLHLFRQLGQHRIAASFQLRIRVESKSKRSIPNIVEFVFLELRQGPKQ